MEGSVLITGGTGFIGGAFARHLLTRTDIAVRLLGRNFGKSADLVALGGRPLQTDLRDREGVIAACDGVDTVFHIGALSAPWSPGGRRDFYNVNVLGTENLLEGCRRAGVRRLVYVSSPSVVFGGADHRNLAEDAPYPQHFASAYSWSKKLAEDRVRAAGQAGIHTIILRPKAVFGPGDTSLLPRLIAAARAGRLPQIGDGTNAVDLTPVENVVHALCLCQTAPPEAWGHTFTITGGESALLWDVIRCVLRALKIPDPRRQIPLRVALLAAGLMEVRAAVTKKEPLLTRYSALILARTQTYDISAARRSLGYAPIRSLAEGIERTIAALKQDAAREEVEEMPVHAA
ncbi:MAG: NAD-dependent epimerase/dehydratase family protein [Cytophagales bacterium]|nr:NAD-dependent epimerase/dehydratase family protein [Armatimonadota bacterium]